MKKIKTHIPGFDRLICGGFSKGKTILLSGTPGTGKSIFGLQFLYNGITKESQKGIYISFEEKKKDLITQAEQFGWNLNDLIRLGKLKILCFSPEDLKNNTVEELISTILKENYERVIIDSLSALSINIPTTHTQIKDITPFAVERFIYRFLNSLKKLGESTAIVISQTSDGMLSRDGVSEFIADGIINITYESIGGEFSRSLIIRKMRECNNDEDVHPLEIGKKGIKIHNIT